MSIIRHWRRFSDGKNDRRDLDLSSLQKVSEGEEGYIYRDGDMAYKLFKTRNLKILNGKAEKIECLSKLSVG